MLSQVAGTDIFQAIIILSKLVVPLPHKWTTRILNLIKEITIQEWEIRDTVFAP